MNKKKLLIVDDDRDLIRGLSIRLQACGYDLVFATDGISAISVAQKEKPDLIILDLGLPAGDGFTVMGRCKSILPLFLIPIIVLTAREPLLNQERALETGAVAYFQKPVANDELLAAIRKALGENGGPKPEKPPAPEAGNHPTQKKILVVDDDKDLLRALSLRLKDHDYNVVLAVDAPSAITMVQNQKPDLILLDLYLPAGNGFMVLEQLRTLYPDDPIPTIILTSQHPSVAKQRCLEAGATAFFQKPANPRELLAAIQKALKTGVRSLH